MIRELYKNVPTRGRSEISAVDTRIPLYSCVCFSMLYIVFFYELKKLFFMRPKIYTYEFEYKKVTRHCGGQ